MQNNIENHIIIYRILARLTCIVELILTVDLYVLGSF